MASHEHGFRAGTWEPASLSLPNGAVLSTGLLGGSSEEEEHGGSTSLRRFGRSTMRAFACAVEVGDRDVGMWPLCSVLIRLATQDVVVTRVTCTWE
ncbi:hypothetical protein ZWY2020_040221 [Hordeum vulgare]|nr:hypothetical protein ZWY2020_040221 [Hordeum vulgare]